MNFINLLHSHRIMYGIFTYIYHKNQPHVGQIYHTWILGDIASSNFPVMKSSLWPSRVPSASSWLIWLRESAVVPYRSCHRASSTSCSLSSRGWWKHLLILHNVIVLMSSPRTGTDLSELVQAHGCLQELFWLHRKPSCAQSPLQEWVL